MTEFIDDSTATRFEKAKRFLNNISNSCYSKYFHDDGFPRIQNIQNDAKATLEVFEELLAVYENFMKSHKMTLSLEKSAKDINEKK